MPCLETPNDPDLATESSLKAAVLRRRQQGVGSQLSSIQPLGLWIL